MIIYQYENCLYFPLSRKGRGTRDQIANTHWIREKAKEFQENIYLCLVTILKHLTVWIITNCGKLLKKWDGVVTFLGSLVQSCCGEGGRLETSITGVCGACSQRFSHTGSAPAHGLHAFPVYPAQALGCSAGNLDAHQQTNG